MNRLPKSGSVQAGIFIATAITCLFWFVPILRWATVPLQLLNTHIHEACHAIAASASGGIVARIDVHANGNGETITGGGFRWLIACAGYLGASVIGAAIIVLARSPRAAKAILIGLAVLTSYSLVVWVRGDFVGIVSGFIWVGGLLVLVFRGGERQMFFAAQFIGVQQCANALQSLFFLVQISGFGVMQSDAGNMATDTGIPAIFWAGLWSLISLGLMALALRFSLAAGPPTSSESTEPRLAG